MKCYRICLLVLSICGLFTGLGAKEGDGGYAGAFLRLGAGVRGSSMGGAYAAVSDDITASYYNPAGLGQLRAIQVIGVYATSSLHRNQYYIGAAFPGSVAGTVAFSWINYSIGDIDGRDAMGNATGTFSNSENAFYVSLGKSIADVVFIGGNLKYLSHSLAEHNAMGVSADLGLMVKPASFLAVGLTFQDVSNHIKWDTDSHTRESIPATIRAGIAVKPGTIPLIIALDLEKNEKQSSRIHAGVEYYFYRQLGFRAGYDHGSLTAGFSLQFPLSRSNAHHMDFSYGLFDDRIDAVQHRFSSCFTVAPTSKSAKVEKKPLVQGKVRALVREFAYIDIGSNAGLQQQQRLYIFRKGKDNDLRYIAEAKVVRLRKRVAAIKLLDVRENVNIQVNDVVRPANP